MANDKQITGALGVLAAGYPHFNLTPETIRVYQRTLTDIPGEVLDQAVMHLLTTSKFFPSVAEIREACFGIMTNAAEIPSAFEAWQEVQDQIALCGDYFRYDNGRKPSYSHPLVSKAVEIMGYQNLCMSDNMVADRAHFFKVYESLYRRAEADMKMLPAVKEFAGKYQIEAQNQIKLLAEKMEAK